jgi:hypothetical protein
LGEWGFLDNLADTSGNGHTATANFSPTYIDGPTTGTRAIRFSGTNQTVDYGRTGLEPVVAAGGVVTMAWVKLFAAHFNYTGILQKVRADDSSRHSINASGDTVFWMSRWRDQLVFAENGSYLVDRGWHHLCNVDADDRYAWYVDGVQIQGAARTGSSPVTWEAFNWRSGYVSEMVGYQSDPNVAFTGLRIFSGTMSTAEVQAWRDTPVAPTGRSGRPKVWSGSAWNPKPAKVWNGTAWVEKPMTAFDGTDFVDSK